jgi:hypothetical protein
LEEMRAVGYEWKGAQKRDMTFFFIGFWTCCVRVMFLRKLKRWPRRRETHG